MLNNVYFCLYFTASEDEEVDKYMLPTPKRWSALNEMLQFLVSASTIVAV